MAIDDPLKSLAEICQPDPRRTNIIGSLAAEHEDLASIELNDNVPQVAAQLFETAKNVSLYSWFVYRFHPVAESVGFSALELALNLRKTGATVLPPDFRSSGLSKLLREAIDTGLLRESFRIAAEFRGYALRRKNDARIRLYLADRQTVGPSSQTECGLVGLQCIPVYQGVPQNKILLQQGFERDIERFGVLGYAEGLVPGRRGLNRLVLQ